MSRIGDYVIDQQEQADAQSVIEYVKDSLRDSSFKLALEASRLVDDLSTIASRESMPLEDRVVINHAVEFIKRGHLDEELTSARPFFSGQSLVDPKTILGENYE